jgi:hypothetical protein
MYVFHQDRSRKREGQVRKFETGSKVRNASPVPTAAKAAKAFTDRVCFGLAFGRLERDRSLADGRLKHQRTERTIEHVFLTWNMFFDLSPWVRAGADPDEADPERLGTGPKDESYQGQVDWLDSMNGLGDRSMGQWPGSVTGGRAFYLGQQKPRGVDVRFLP